MKKKRTDEKLSAEQHEDPAEAIIAASMELKLHGVPRDRNARRRLEAVLGDVMPARVDNGEESGHYNPLRFGLDGKRWGV